jgi:hypothetical protein
MAHLKSIMKTIKTEVRVVLLLCYAIDFESVMKTAQGLGMSQGDFVYISYYNLAFISDNLMEGTMITKSVDQPTKNSWYKFATDVVESFNDPAFRGYSGLEKSSSPANVASLASKYFNNIQYYK